MIKIINKEDMVKVTGGVKAMLVKTSNREESAFILKELYEAMNKHFVAISKAARTTNKYVSDKAKIYREIIMRLFNKFILMEIGRKMVFLYTITEKWMILNQTQVVQKFLNFYVSLEFCMGVIFYPR